MASNFQWLYFARVGGFHVQGTYGQSYSELCFALNNAADGSLRRARLVGSTYPVEARRAKSEAESEAQRVKINEIK